MVSMMNKMPAFLYVLLFLAVDVNAYEAPPIAPPIELAGSLEVIDNCTCGMSDVNERSYNEGSTVDLKKYPWLVAIYQPMAANPWGTCGGAIISKQLILTAASCTERNDIKVRLLSALKWKQDRNIPIMKIIQHPKYKRNKNVFNDIALIKLERPIHCTKYSRPICLPRMDMKLAQPNTKLLTAGWENSVYLQEGAATVIQNGVCQRKRTFDYNRICTKDILKTICHGGLGAPSFVKHKGKYFAVGIAVDGCKNMDDPTVFTRVVRYRRFINRHMKKGANMGK